MASAEQASAPAVTFVNRYYYPDQSATAQMLTDLATGLARAGWRVRVITSRQLYNDPAADLPASDLADGVEILRVATTRFGRSSKAERLLDFLAFFVTSFLAVRRAAGDSDVVVAKTDPPLISLPVAAAALGRRGRTVNWLQDLYPEVASALGLPAVALVGRPLAALRNWSLRRAAVNVAIGQRMRERLIATGLAERQIAVIPNWADDGAVHPDPAGAAALRRAWGYGADWFILGYSGNLGEAHEIDTILGAARLTAGHPGIWYLFVGGGRYSAELKARAEAEGLNQILFQPYQPRAMLAASLSVANAHWLSLRPALEGLIVPSKVYGIAAAGRAIVAIADANGEVARIVGEADGGFVIAPGDAAALATVLRRMAADPELTARLGRAARDWLEQANTKAAMIGRWDQILRRAAAGGLAASSEMS